MPTPEIPNTLYLDSVFNAPGAPPGPYSLIDWVTDGTVQSLLFLVLLGILLRVALRRCRPAVIWTLLGVTAFSVLLRYVMPVETSFTAWPYKRAVPLALSMYEGPVLAHLSGWFGFTIYLDDLVFEVNRWMAMLSPLALFLHSRKLLRHDGSAIVAAAILAVYPSHIRHSASDVLFIQSLFMSSLAFAALYTAMEESRRWWGVASAIAFPFLAVSCYQSRPLNIIFAPLFLAALLLTIRGHSVPRRISVIAGGVICATAAWSIWTYLLPHFSGQVRSGLSVETLAGFYATFTGPQNVIFDPWITPIGLIVLFLAGAVYLWRRGGDWRLKGVFLVGWFFAFFVAHGVIPTAEVLVVSRYLLHLAPPVILLAAATTPLLQKLSHKVLAAAVVYLLAVPFIHASFIGAVSYNQQQEKAFLLASRDAVPDACTVLEYSSSSNNDCAGWFGGFGSRILRTGSRLRNGQVERAWTAGIFQSVGTGTPLSLERTLAELDLGEDSCLYYYRGFECYIRGTAFPPMAGPCAALERSFDLEPIRVTRFPARTFDLVFSGYHAVVNKPHRDEESFNNMGAPIELGFFRVKGLREGREGGAGSAP